jgi:PIN domain nuclease of toxin-antitoxin system
VNYLLDTQLLLWLAVSPAKIPSGALRLMEDQANDLYFSPISIYEVAVKRATRASFLADPATLQRELRAHGIVELPLISEHAATVLSLPPLHKDPFDRLLLSQAITTGMTLLTTDDILRRYPSNVLDVR